MLNLAYYAVALFAVYAQAAPHNKPPQPNKDTSKAGVVAANCQPSRVLGSGFNVVFYDYPYYRDDGWQPGWFEGGYKNNAITATKKGVQDIYFSNQTVPWGVVRGTVYDTEVNISNFAMELSGFFKADYTGTYTFTLKADNGASLQLGAGQSCCDDAGGSVGGGFNIFTLGPRGGGGDVDANTNRYTASFDLQEGRYYPVKLVYFNWVTNAGLDLSYVDPKGTTVKNFANKISQLQFDNGVCITSTTEYWTNKYTSTTTRTGKSTNTVVVELPHLTTTTTTTWGNSFTSSVTKTGSITDTIVVEVPSATVTTTTYWNKPMTSLTTVTTGKDGTNTVIVQVPKTTVTKTSTWTNNFSSTSTAVGSVTDTVIVDVPSPTKTVTSYWTQTTTGATTITTGTDGTNTVTGSATDTVEIDVPTPTKTITSYWEKPTTATTTVTTGTDGTNTLL
ncbi:hypothetical protein PUMCH_000815 [Australozyma saopauloensis]|uniref:PA14 domain-containing protein n=1 Tax=Australozyma saopauloensis TaxID=291208 RepID=A0AAX4H5N5_9ASCO|nr:hypothetical protein PUMCH_000815 [[Candida] saopauloensis]